LDLVYADGATAHGPGVGLPKDWCIRGVHMDVVARLMLRSAGSGSQYLASGQ
jgi:hypothetical protein